MDTEAGALLLTSILLILGNGFFVAAEYSIVSSRRSSIEALAKRTGRGNARRVLRALDNISPYVAACQIGITMLGIGVGTVTEPYVTHVMGKALGQAIDPKIGYALSFLIVAFVMVVIGELAPKHTVLKHPEPVALVLIRPLEWCVTLFKPIIWLAQKATGLILRPFHIDVHETSKDLVPKDELLLLVKAGGVEGVLDVRQAEMVTKALRIDQIDAQDIMVHRLDIKYLDASLPKEEVIARVREIPYTRLPVCRGDIDDLIGIVYLHDIVKHMHEPGFSLEAILRPAVAIPENLPTGKIISQMRESKTQMLIVRDEYGGTSGLLTLEDVVEEIFGELEDSLESERPAIEVFKSGRISAKADTRVDELLSYIGRDLGANPNTDSLATVIVNSLARVPRPGDSVETEFGTLRVENMARRRITRVTVNLTPNKSEEASAI